MIPDILDQHAEELTFLWLLRDAAALGPHYDLPALAELDERLDAHLDGLRLAAAEGLVVLRDAAAAGEPGAVFAAALLALERADAEAFAPLLDIAAADPAAARGLVSACAWAPFDRVRAALDPWLQPSAPAPRRRVAVAAWAAHRRDPGGPLSFAILDKDPALRARALRAAGELGRADLRAEVLAALADADEASRFWAAWSAALLGDTHAAARALWAIASAGGAFAERAVDLAARRAEPARARQELEALAADPARARLAAIGYAALGDPAAAPWLLQALRDPKLARIAGEAFATLTGLRIEGALAGRPPEGFQPGPTDDPADANVAMHPDEKRPWPAPEAVEAAWRGLEGRLRRGQRHLLGAPLSPEALARTLRDGTQRQRAGAAIERVMLDPGQPLLEVRAPAARQLAAQRSA